MRGLRTGDLVALVAPPGPAWPDLLRAAWDAGAAVLPLDPSSPERDRIMAAARPTVIADEHGTQRLPDGIAAPTGCALAVATSGTTGEPKVVLIGRRALDHAVAASLVRLGAGDEPWLCCLPVTHLGGLLVLARALHAGAPVTFGAPRPEVIARARAGFTSLVPTLVSRCLDAGADLSGYRAILVGGDALDPALAARVPAIVTTYGMTETCGGVVYDGVPLDGVEVAVEDDEILLGGPTVMLGYRDRGPAGAWIRTGDAGTIVAGRLTVHGRLDDRITTGGHKVYPHEVELALRSHPAVREALVYGEPDPEWGARVIALVEPADPHAPPSSGSLAEHLAGDLAPYKIPKDIRFGPLPSTAAGTLDRTTRFD